MIEKDILLTFLALPFVSAAIIYVLRKTSVGAREFLTGLSSLAVFAVSVYIFASFPRADVAFDFVGLPWTVKLSSDWISSFIAMLISFVGCLAVFYSFDYMRRHEGLERYYPFLLAFIGSMNGAVLAGDLLTMFFFWELMSLFAFFLVIFDGSDTALKAGAKYLIMNGAGSLLMLLAIGLLYFSQGGADLDAIYRMAGQSSGEIFMLAALFVVGLGVKAGMVPLHTWLPDAHPAAPSPVSALLSGVMIKVGIFWIFKIFVTLFGFSQSWNFILCLLGSVTIIVGGMMLLVQSDIKRLLAYSTVSQIGYMILGIGTGVSAGIFGGLFHLLNHALFKGLLFLCAGAIIYRTGTRDLNNYGGLLKGMPVTFITCLVAALSISGVPPFNGFVSKWMIYQGIIEAGAWGWWIFLAAAVFGSALTLAALIKVIFSVFFGERPPALKEKNIREVGAAMRAPLIILAFLCVVFGIFPQIPLNWFFKMNISGFSGEIAMYGIWNPSLATMLILAGIVLGALVYWLNNAPARTAGVFIGGEKIDPEKTRIPGATMYNTIKEMKYFRGIYKTALGGGFDIYVYAMDWARGLSGSVGVTIDGAIDKLYDMLGKTAGAFGRFMLDYSWKIAIVLGAAAVAGFFVWPGAARMAAVLFMLLYALMAVGENNIKRFTAWCVLSQAGYVILGLSFPQGVTVAVSQAAVSLTGWILLALSLRYLREGGTEDIGGLAGAAERMPLATVVFIIGGFGLAGLPPMLGFLAKFDLSLAGWTANPAYSFTIVAAALITCGYVLKVARVLLEKNEISET